MQRRCEVCKKTYKHDDSDATYIYVFCSFKCEEESYDLNYDESAEPSEYLKDEI